MNELQTYLKASAKQKSVAFAPFFFHASEETKYELVDLELDSNCCISESNDHEYFQNRQGYSDSSNHTLMGSLPDSILFKPASSDPSEYRPERIICVVGAHGYGKTAIAKRYLERYSKSELHDVDYLFLLQCRQINFEACSNLLQLLANSLPFSWICDKSACENVLDELCKSEKVMIIIDDLHWAKKSFQSSDATTSLKDETTAAAFIKSLLSTRTVLPKAKVLVTVRPKHLYDNPKLEFYSQYFYNILGLPDSSQNKMCQAIYKKNSEKIFEFISFYPFLKSFCSVPLNCPFVVFASNSCLSDDIPYFSLPLTRIIIHAYMRLLQNQNMSLNPKVLEELAGKAWTQICDKSLKDFAESHLMDDTVSAFFKVFPVQKEQTTQPLIRFHPLWLEWLAAFHCILAMDAKNFNKFLSNDEIEDHNQPWRFVAMHVASMLDENTAKYVEQLLPHFQFDQKVFSQKMKALLNVITKKLQNPQSFSSFLFASCLVHSMQCKKLAEVYANQLNYTLVISGSVYPSDITGLHYILQARTKPICLKVDLEVKFNKNSLSVLVQALKHVPSKQVSYFKIQYFSIT